MKKFKPKLGHKAYAIRFAFLPIITEDNKTLWLQKYIAEYEMGYGKWLRFKTSPKYIWKRLYYDFVKQNGNIKK